MFFFNKMKYTQRAVKGTIGLDETESPLPIYTLNM